MKTVEAARGRWIGILRHFGLDDRYLQNRHGPCPICEGRDRYRFDDKDGAGTFYCSKCGAGDGMKLAMLWTGREFADVAREIDEIVGNIDQVDFQADKPDPRIRLQEVANMRVPIDSINPVRAYLKSRGLKPVPGIEYCEAVKYWDMGSCTEYPAMVCLMRGPDNAPLTWHVTHLTNGGQKAPVGSVRKILPPVRPLAGSAIRLGGMAREIGIAEGVETALAVMSRYGIPCWAAANATLMEKFTPPGGVEAITIFGDNDSSYTGQKAAYTLAHRLRDKVTIRAVRIPEAVDTDFADELLSKGETA